VDARDKRGHDGGDNSGFIGHSKDDIFWFKPPIRADDAGGKP
jgi:hypothetical protein